MKGYKVTALIEIYIEARTHSHAGEKAQKMLDKLACANPFEEQIVVKVVEK